MRAVKSLESVDHRPPAVSPSAPAPFTVRKSRKISLPALDGINFERISDIISVEAEGNYTRFSFRDGRQLLVCRTLRDVEALIRNRRQFVRIHRSYIINLDYLRKYIRGKGGTAVMENGAAISISAGKKQRFLEALKDYFE